MENLPIGLQLFSIREEASTDFFSVMKKVKDMGYDGVELAGLYGYLPEEIRDGLKEIGLVPISAHVPYEELQRDLEGSVASYQVIGCKYIAIPYLMEKDRYSGEGYQTFLRLIPKMAEECRKYDMVLMYHNHDFEFQKTESGEYVLDALFKQFPKDVLQTEIDTCWVKASGVEPVDYITQYKDRCPLVHLKDLTGEVPVVLTPVGYGIQDVKGILGASVSSGAKWIIVEQDDHMENSPMEDAKLSLDYVKGLEW